MKICGRCNVRKENNYFFKDSSRKSGLTPRCKDCIKEYRNLPHVRSMYNSWSRSYNKTENGKRLKSKNWDKVKLQGRDYVYFLVRKLEKKPCEKCGTSKYVHAHHDDYSKPLDVLWLCPLHHKQRHKELDNGQMASAI